MSPGAESSTAADRAGPSFAEMLRRVRDVDPQADAEAVRRYAREMAEADAVLQAIQLDPSKEPLHATFSPGWLRP